MPSLRTRLLATILALVSLPDAAAAQAISSKAAAPALPAQVRWAVAVPARPAAPPVIGADKVFISLQSGIVAAHRLEDGSEAWRLELRSTQPVAFEGDRLFVAAGDALHALRSEDATVEWRAAAGALTAPMVAQDGWIIAASTGELAAFRAADGTKIWGRETGAQHGRPSIEGDNLYVPLDDGRLLALDLRSGAELWVQRLGSPRELPGGRPAPALSEILAYPDRLFFGASNGLLYCLDATDGTLIWRSRIGAVLRGGPVGDGTRVFVTSADNVVRGFNRMTGARLWQGSVAFRPSTGPVLIGSALMVPGAAKEVRAFTSQGAPAGQIKLEDDLAIAPAFAEAPSGTVMAAITGSLTGQWKLLVFEAARGVDVVPLAVLPGISVPVVPPPPPVD